MANSILAKMAVIIDGQTAQFNKAMAQSQGQLKSFTSGLKSVGSALGITFGATAIFNGLKVAVGIMSEFEATMSTVRAITGATGKEFEALEKDALRLGAATKFSANEVGQLQIAYGRLGFNTKEILDATEATLDLAAATGEDLAKAADVAGSTVRGFGLEARDTQRIVDVMAKSFNTTALGLDNFAEAMKYVAPIANAANVSVEETTALLGVLADAGIRGSSAGTALRKIFGDLSKDGRPFQERLAELSKKGITLSDSFDEVGRTAQTALLVLTKNKDKADELTASFGNVSGEAAKMARAMSDNLTGDIEKLTGAWEGLILSLGKTGPIRDATQAITGLLSALTGESGDPIDAFKFLAQGIKDGLKESDPSFQSFLDRIKEIRKETGKPIDINIVNELADKYKLTEEQANTLYRAILNVNKALSFQETALKQFNDFQLGGELTRQLEQLKIDKKSAFTTEEVQEFDRKIAETSKNLEEHREKFGDVGVAIDAYKGKLYELILAEQVHKDSLIKNRQPQTKIIESDKQIAEYRAVIDILNNYASTFTATQDQVIKAQDDTTISLEFYRNALKKVNEEFDKTNVNDLSKLRTLSAQAAGYDEIIKRLEKLKSSGDFEIKITVPNLLPLLNPIKEIQATFGSLKFDVITTSLDEVNARFEAGLDKLAKTTKTKTDEIKQNFIDLGPSISSSLVGVGEALGNAIAGVGNFGKDILKVVTSFARQLGEILIATGVAMLAAKKLITNPYTAIIAGIALVAIAGAASAAISKSHSGSFGGGGTSSSATENTRTATGSLKPDNQLEIKIGGEWRIQGNDLVYIFNRQQQLNGRTTG
jgi:hypothetical protein